jgi:hypothetical protein
MPVRSCCMQDHAGVVCPDGMVRCCLCFERVPIEGLHVLPDGSREDVCELCHVEQVSRDLPRSGK